MFKLHIKWSFIGLLALRMYQTIIGSQDVPEQRHLGRPSQRTSVEQIIISEQWHHNTFGWIYFAQFVPYPIFQLYISIVVLWQLKIDQYTMWWFWLPFQIVFGKLGYWWCVSIVFTGIIYGTCVMYQYRNIFFVIDGI